MTNINFKEYKKAGDRWVSTYIYLEENVRIWVSAAFYRGYGAVDVGIMGLSGNKWTVPTTYQLYTSNTEHNLVEPRGYQFKELNTAFFPVNTGEKEIEGKLFLKTPFGDINFDIKADISHRKQYLEVISTEIPSGIQIYLG